MATPTFPRPADPATATGSASPFTRAELARLAFWRWRVQEAPAARRLVGDTASDRTAVVRS